jgi:hypothetical protein
MAVSIRSNDGTDRQSGPVMALSIRSNDGTDRQSGPVTALTVNPACVVDA